MGDTSGWLLYVAVCDRAALKTTGLLDIADDTWDETRLQAMRCLACGFTATATYNESRRGAQRPGNRDHR